MTRRSNHTASVFKYAQCPLHTNGMPRHATTGRNLDNVIRREISHVKKGSFAKAPLIRDHHTERKQDSSFRDRRVGKKQGDAIQFQCGMKENF